MKILKMALAAAFAVASTSVTAGVMEAQPKNDAVNASHCHYAFSVRMIDGVYDVYDCHYIGDGWY